MRYRAGELTEAIPIAEQALAVAEEAFGPNDARVAQVLNDLGHLYLSQQDPAHAEGLHERALKIREQTFSGDGPAVVQSLNNLAKVYVAQERYAQAQPLFERAIAITERHVPPMSPSLIAVLEPYASALRRDGKLEAAEVIEARITTLRARPSGDSKPE
jgi:tetratricopeptide (TPR) repeat protein